MPTSFFVAPAGFTWSWFRVSKSPTSSVGQFWPPSSSTLPHCFALTWRGSMWWCPTLSLPLKLLYRTGLSLYFYQPSSVFLMTFVSIPKMYFSVSIYQGTFQIHDVCKPNGPEKSFHQHPAGNAPAAPSLWQHQVWGDTYWCLSACGLNYRNPISNKSMF